MDKIPVAAAQQQFRIYSDVEDFRQDVYRFLRLAANKGARLVAFPEGAGVPLDPPLMSGFGLGLLRAMEQGDEQGASWWTRARGSLASTAAKPFLGSFRSRLTRLLEREPERLRSLYMEVFSRAAREWGLTLVAGSTYLVEGGQRLNQALVFGPDGSLLGTQAKVHLHPADEGLAQPGDDFQAISTPVARVGVLFGTDALYPEVGRILALQGAEVFVCLAACPGRLLAQKVRQAFEARVQENQVFGIAAFLVGKNHLQPREPGPDFVGRSAVLAPCEMTPRGTGVLVELGTEQGPGIVVGTLDFDLLGQVQALSEAPVRRAMRMDIFARHLPAFYQSGQPLQEAARRAVLAPPVEIPGPPGLLPEAERVAPEGLPPAGERPRWPAEATWGPEVEPQPGEAPAEAGGPEGPPPDEGWLDEGRR
ncbi:MAG: nitrilase-related carbon-nitrogen hydrolase [Anaerolineae bacterium]